MGANRCGDGRDGNKPLSGRVGMGTTFAGTGMDGDKPLHSRVGMKTNLGPCAAV